MTTLAKLKQDIADDLDKNLEDAPYAAMIADGITKAIRYYQNTRFYFNESRDETFQTVANQKIYSSSDDVAIPRFIAVDQVILIDGAEPAELCQINPKEWEMLTASGTSVGRPESWCYFNQSIGFYPIPSAAYTIRVIGQFMKAGPSSDADAGNVWMTEAFELLRARVCVQLAQRRLKSPEVAALHAPMEADELNRLSSETASRVGTGFVTPTEF